MKLSDIIVRSAVAGLKLQGPDGAMPAGHNGPYRDPETPVRNTGHWLMIFAKAHETTGDRRFFDGMALAADYLCGPDARPHRSNFAHRTNPRKDRCNGVIGAAWTIEALVAGAEAMGRGDLLALAGETFGLHPFDEMQGIWHRVEIDGQVLDPDLTLNHQLWFAAAAADLAAAGWTGAAAPLRRFLDRLPSNMATFRSGLIVHALVHKKTLRDHLREVRARLRDPKRRRAQRVRDIGYHAFNLYAFAILKRHFPDHPFWSGDLFAGAWRYADNDRFARALDDNRFGYPYNPPGFEMAMAIQTFGPDSLARRVWWVSEQVRRCFDFESDLMQLGTEDRNTHAARLYEAVRLDDLALDLPESAP